jgi:hypothetical protein
LVVYALKGCLPRTDPIMSFKTAICHSESPFGRLCPERVLTSNECEKSLSWLKAPKKDLSSLAAVRDDRVKRRTAVRDDNKK